MYECVFVLDCAINEEIKDMVFLVDISYNAESSEFQMIKELVDNITTNLRVGSPESSVALILFDNITQISFTLEAITLSQAINPRLNVYSRNTSAALSLLLSSTQNGSLGIRNETSKIAIVITGGQSDDPNFTQSAAAALHAANIFDVYAVGYDSADIFELNTIATGPDFVYVTDIEELQTNVLCSCKTFNILCCVIYDTLLHTYTHVRVLCIKYKRLSPDYFQVSKLD